MGEGVVAAGAVTTKKITKGQAEGVVLDVAETAYHSESILKTIIVKDRRRISVAEAEVNVEQMKVAKARGLVGTVSSADKGNAVISISSRRDVIGR